MSDIRDSLLQKLDEDFFLFLWSVKDSAAKLFKPVCVPNRPSSSK